MKIEFNQEELVEALMLLLSEQGFKADKFIVDNFRFVAGRNNNGDRVEVELSKRPTEFDEPEEVKVIEYKEEYTQPSLPFEPEEDNPPFDVEEETPKKKLGDIFNG